MVNESCPRHRPCLGGYWKWTMKTFWTCLEWHRTPFRSEAMKGVHEGSSVSVERVLVVFGSPVVDISTTNILQWKTWKHTHDRNEYNWKCNKPVRWEYERTNYNIGMREHAKVDVFLLCIEGFSCETNCYGSFMNKRMKGLVNIISHTLVYEGSSSIGAKPLLTLIQGEWKKKTSQALDPR